VSFRASTPLPRRLDRRARRRLGLPASRVCILPVEGGAWLDVADRAGVWFTVEEWAALVLDGLELLLELSTTDGLDPGERAALVQALAAARATGT